MEEGGEDTENNCFLLTKCASNTGVTSTFAEILLNIYAVDQRAKCVCRKRESWTQRRNQHMAERERVWMYLNTLISFCCTSPCRRGPADQWSCLRMMHNYFNITLNWLFNEVSDQAAHWTAGHSINLLTLEKLSSQVQFSLFKSLFRPSVWHQSTQTSLTFRPVGVFVVFRLSSSHHDSAENMTLLHSVVLTSV